MQKFIIKSPNGHLLEHNMRTDMITMGRDPSNDIVLNAPSVSRRHARIYIWEGSYCIEDLGSSNGVYVNGHKISEAVAIDPSCRIDVGGFEFSFGGSPAAAGGGTNISQIQKRPSTAPAASGIRLVGLTEPIRDQVFAMPTTGEVTIGRADNNTITLHHNSVSRNHARILVGGGEVVLQDLGSSNGCLINNKKITRQAIPPGAEIRIGHVGLRLDDPNAQSVSKSPGSFQQSAPFPEKMSQKELIKYAIIFLVLIIFMLGLTIVLVQMLSSSSGATDNQTAIPPTAVQPLKTGPDK